MMRIMSSGKVAAALAAVAILAAPAAAQAAPVAGQLVASGSFSISPDGTTVSGVLPPGSSVSQPPLDPADPGYAKRFAAATNRQGLTVAPAISASAPALVAPAIVRPLDVPHAGCVSAIGSLSARTLYYKGQMAGCSRGNLWLHTYLNKGSTRVQDNPVNTCDNSTSCSVPNAAYTVSSGTYFSYAHGRNNSTGGDDTAWQEWDLCGC